MFPLAFGFFASESKPNWIWFMEQLSKAIGPVDNLAVCTDAKVLRQQWLMFGLIVSRGSVLGI
jgi:hypothetical protein